MCGIVGKPFSQNFSVLIFSCMAGFGCGIVEVVLLKYLKKQTHQKILPDQLSISRIPKYFRQ